MKAIVWTSYGPPDVLQLQEVEKPRPKDNEVLIKIHAATVTAGDCEARSLKFPFWLALPMRLYTGVLRPSRVVILGQELAGEVEAVGRNVELFRPGDAIFGTTGFRFGAYAEYVCLPAESDAGVLAHKPANMTYEEAAAVPTGGLEALHFLRSANLQRGQRLLINGAGGSIGTAGIQLARYYGAEITAVDSAEKLEMLRSIGADHVIDYTQDDFAKSGRTYDVIFDVVGRRSFARSMRALKENGVYLLANPGLSAMLRGAWMASASRKKVFLRPATRERQDLLFLKALIEADKLKAVIDRRYPLGQTAEAHRYVETGRKQGNVVITIRQGSDM